MNGPERRLRFTLTDEDLDEAINLLCGFDAYAFHPDACDILMREVERRQDGETPQDIQIASRTFDRLPAVVRALLFNHVSVEPRRAA
jgi:hypothetical protein